MCDLNTRITRKKDLLTANVNLFDILHLWLPSLTKIYILHGIYTTIDYGTLESTTYINVMGDPFK